MTRRDLCTGLLIVSVILGAPVMAASQPVAPDDTGVAAPHLIAESHVAPEYPASAFAAKHGAVVSVRVDVMRDGSVGDVEVLDTSMPGLGFEAAAEEAVTQWQFDPARQDGEPIDSYTFVRLSFNPPHGIDPGLADFQSTQMPAPGAAQRGSGLRRSPLVIRPTDGGGGGSYQANKSLINTYGRPGGRRGGVYDRRSLIPAAPPGHIERTVPNKNRR